MKVTCEYCGSYVEADQNGMCPCCQAPLGDAIRAAEEARKAEEEAKAQQEAEEKAQQAKQEQVSKTLAGIAGVAGALLGSTRQQAHTMRPPHGTPPQPPMDHTAGRGRGSGQADLRPSGQRAGGPNGPRPSGQRGPGAPGGQHGPGAPGGQRGPRH